MLFVVLISSLLSNFFTKFSINIQKEKRITKENISLRETNLRTETSYFAFAKNQYL